MSDRKKALKWWSTLDYETQYDWFAKYCNIFTRSLEQIYDSEIEEIWVGNIKNLTISVNTNNLVGIVLTKSANYHIEIIDLDKIVPIDAVEKFKEWLKNKAVELGVGKHHEHYGYTNNYQDDIGVTFFCSVYNS